MLFTTFALLLAQAGAAPSVPAVPPPVPPPCTSAGHRAFDFWVGEWTVTVNGQDQPVATSRIENLYGGCTIRENWMPNKGAGGGSLNAYDPASGRWYQFWVDGQGSRVEFHGGLAGNKMVLTGFWRHVNGPGKHALIRMTYTPIDADTVRQHGESSTDQGQTWSTSFDYIYRRAKPAG